ncbi:MAG: hypothetical protein JST47_07865 [Bacteroidetes bacterium]|nr:hypothetical protein [Bacteroidota bacterium]MBS1972886.1 hypothetical protein [Bacteroidota bacterium]
MRLKKTFVFIGLALDVLFCMSQSNAQLQQIKDFVKNSMMRSYDSSLDYVTIKPKGNLNYLYPLYQLFKQEHKFRLIESDNGYNDEVSKAASFLEDYQTVLEYQLKNYATIDPATEKQIRKTIEGLKGIEHADAIKYISFAAQRYNVVMINESYNKPLHRAFVISLLDELYRKGFRYLAMETLNSHLQKTGSRLTAATGYLTNEPVGGELVRRATELGFTLVPYGDTSAARTLNGKDSAQAANIFKILLHDHSAKILVVGSYGHVAKKSPDKNYIPMGLAFKRLSGINPLSIDQVSMCDASEFAYGKALYEAYTDQFSLSVPSVAMADGQAVNITNDDSYDICIIHPRTIYRNNRPTWLSLGGLRQAVYVKSTVNGTFLVQAYYDNETKLGGPEQTVPADQSYLTSNKDSYLLYLRKGKYLIVFRDIAYHLIGKLNIEVN